MGSGIVQAAASSGFKVVMCDVSDAALVNGHNSIAASLKRLARRAHPTDEPSQNEYVASAMSNIQSTTDPLLAVESADLVVEAVVENLRVKQDLFQALDTVAKESSIFTSNTSSLLISEIAAMLPKARRERFAGWHFFNPVAQMKLVEVSRTADTSSAVIESILAVTRAMGKTPVACKDTPGFVVNRLLVPFLMEAIRLVERGDADILDVDVAMQLGAGHPMGPLTLADYIGLDTLKFIVDGTLACFVVVTVRETQECFVITQGWHKTSLKDASASSTSLESLSRPSLLLNAMIEKGWLGRKGGVGFYRYHGGGEAKPNWELEEFIRR
ncbi:hypothetical protein HDU93_002024 [Gonapodya sp. JEL0774]|nr:hypothetical protein HDU93_002024 [Gonapodya sp. JEL0774]